MNMDKQDSKSPGAVLDAGLLKVVVADDSEIIREAVRDLFEPIGAEVHAIESAIGLSGLLHRVHPDAVVLDVNMPAIRGDEAVAAVRRICPRAAIVLFSSEPDVAEYARKRGVAWVSKRTPELLVRTVLRHATANLGSR